MSFPGPPGPSGPPGLPRPRGLPEPPVLPDLSGIPDHKEEMVRRMLDGPHPPVPPDLGARAAARGVRAVARRRMLHVLVVVLAGAAVGALLVWAAVTQPWSAPEITTPPVGGL